MAISSPGIGSGIDVGSIVKQLVAIEAQPLRVLEKKEAGFQAQVTAYGTLKGALAAFQSAMSGLGGVSKFQSTKAASADVTIFSASGTSVSVPGAYSIEVKQLAQTHKLASGDFATVATEVGTGTLTFQFGKWDSGVFTANSDKPSQTVTIEAAKSTLGGVRDAINAARIGVTATIVNTGTQNRLVVTSNDTGESNSLKITVADTADASNLDNAGLSRLAYDPAGIAGNGKNLVQTVAAQNALLKVDGIDNISKSGNTITDVVQGVTITLQKQSSSGVSTALSVTRDTAAVKAAVEEFVGVYNNVRETVDQLTAYNKETKQSSILQGDGGARNIVTQIRRVLTESIDGLSGSYTSLSQIGISFQKDGTLALDATKLQKAIDTDIGAIAGLFARNGVPSDSLVNFTSSTDVTKPGSYAVSVLQLATSGLVNGAATVALADSNNDGTFNTAVSIGATNNTFTVKINGTQSGTITLALGSYTTTAALAAEIQSKLNGDTALKNAGAAATVSFDNTNDRLVITSNNFGAASTVDIAVVGTTTASTLGFAVGTGSIAGVDVAGTINGTSAVASGRFLTAMDGLKIEITGGATGNRGTINFSKGYAYQLDTLATQLLGESGTVASRIKGIKSSIEDLGDRREVLNRRLVIVERRLREQFTAMDVLVSQLRSTGDYLTQQLASLPRASRG